MLEYLPKVCASYQNSPFRHLSLSMLTYDQNSAPPLPKSKLKLEKVGTL